MLVLLFYNFVLIVLWSKLGKTGESYHHESSWFCILNNVSIQMLDSDIVDGELQMQPPLQVHHAQEQIESDSREHLWEQ